MKNEAKQDRNQNVEIEETELETIEDAELKGIAAGTPRPFIICIV